MSHRVFITKEGLDSATMKKKKKVGDFRLRYTF
jgi:hypothetical protein